MDVLVTPSGQMYELTSKKLNVETVINTFRD